MDTYVIKSYLFAGACSVASVIIYHYVFLRIQQSRVHSAISELFNDPMGTPLRPPSLRRTWTKSEDNLVRSKAMPDSELSKKIGRTTAAIHVRRSLLKKK